MKLLRMISLLAVCLLLGTFAAAQMSSAAGTKSTPPVVPSISGSGTTNYIPIWTSSTALGNSKLYQTGGNVGVGTTSPAWALDVNGYINTNWAYKLSGFTVLSLGGSSTNIALGYAALNNNTSGGYNTATGVIALGSDTTGSSNTANGSDALNNNTSGSYNTAIGTFTLFNNNANDNTAAGYKTLYNNNSGYNNTATGYSALYNNTTGYDNTAIGYDALYNNNSGALNIAIGYDAAINVSGGNSSNIHIGSVGSSADSGVIRIGTSGSQSSFYAAGIYGASSGSSSAIQVLVDSSGQLVTVSSSRRFKEDIQDMGNSSRDLMRLRPVTFRYQKPLDDGTKPVQYGLIAEEVAEVYPDMVAYSADGQIQSVKYQMLDPMLLNEVQRQQTQIERQATQIQILVEQLDRMKAALAALSGRPGQE